MSTENRNLHHEIHELIENRPWAFGHILPQKIYELIFYFCMLFALGFTAYKVYDLYKFLTPPENADSNGLTSALGVLPKELQNAIQLAALGNKINELIIMLFLTICFLFCARYARKTIKRNLYILQLEDIIKSSRLYAVVNPPKPESQNATPDANAL